MKNFSRFVNANRYYLLTVTLFMACSSGKAQDTTELKLLHHLPLVLGHINNKPAYFIIDSGSSVTVLNESMSKFYGFRFVPNEFLERTSLVGVGGMSSVRQITRAVVRLGNLDLEFINRATLLDKISSSFADKGISIAGIIGADILSFLGSKIDFSTNTIVFHTADVTVHPPLIVRADCYSTDESINE